MPIDNGITGLTAVQSASINDPVMHRMRYIPEIDGLRAIAVVSVMIAHLGGTFLAGGFVGVDIFFVISGYVVTGSLRHETESGFLSYISSFYCRRVLRIIPALIVCLLSASILTVLFMPPSWLSSALPDVALAAFYGISNIILLRVDSYFAPISEYNTFTHTWSLAVEEQFYLLFPGLLFLATEIRRRSRRLGRYAFVFFVGGPVLISFAFLAAISRGHPDLAFYWLPSRFWELGVGALLYIALERPRFVGVVARHSVALCCAGLFAIALPLQLADPTAFPFPWALPAVFGTTAVIAGVTAPYLLAASGSQFSLVRVLRSPPVVFIGLVSYSLYLWHWVIYTLLRWSIGLESFVTMIGAMVLSLLLAVASTKLLEQPIRRNPGVLAQPRRVILGGGLLVVMLSSGAAWALFEQQDHLDLSRVAIDSDQWYGIEPQPPRDCRSEISVTDLPGGGFHKRRALVCPGTAPVQRKLIMIGDSHTLAYQPMVIQAAEQLGFDTVTYLRSKCTFLDLLHPATGICAAFREAAVDDILLHHAPGDIVFLAALRMIRLTDQYSVPDPVDVDRAMNGAEAVHDRAAALEEASAVIGRIQQAGFVVILDWPKPIFRAPAFRCADWFDRANPICRAGLSMSRTEEESLRQNVAASAAALVARRPGLVKWDSLPILCPGTQCEALPPTGPLFIDGDHISARANELLLPAFVSLIRTESAARH